MRPVSFLVSSAVLVVSTADLVRSDCAMETPSVQEQFERSSIVVRVAATDNLTQSLLCDIEIYDNGYVTTSGPFWTYAIVELYKQDWSDTNVEVLLQPANLIPIVYDTDTGFYKDLPSSLTSSNLNSAGGSSFLAFLEPFRTCHYAANDEPYEMAPDNVLQNAYLLNECNTANVPWSFVSEEDQQWLRAQQDHQAVVTVEENNPNNHTNTTSEVSATATNAPTQMQGEQTAATEAPAQEAETKPEPSSSPPESAARGRYPYSSLLILWIVSLVWSGMDR